MGDVERLCWQCGEEREGSWSCKAGEVRGISCVAAGIKELNACILCESCYYDFHRDENAGCYYPQPHGTKYTKPAPWWETSKLE